MNFINMIQGSLLLGVAACLPIALLAADAHPASSGVTPASALLRLKGGNSRFVRGRLIGENNILRERKALAAGQTPFSAILSCSDSRVPPEEVFDQGLGKLFVVRVAGNVAAAEGIASLEYAVTHLGTKLIVVMGHSSCGAVKATLETPSGQSLGSPSLDVLAQEIRPNLRDLSTDKALSSSIEENARAAYRNIKASSKILAEGIEKGEIKIIPAVYNLQTGVVQFLTE